VLNHLFLWGGEWNKATGRYGGEPRGVPPLLGIVGPTTSAYGAKNIQANNN